MCKQLEVCDPVTVWPSSHELLWPESTQTSARLCTLKMTTTQHGFFLFFSFFFKLLEPKMTQSEPQRQSEPRRLLHAVYI